MARNAKKQQINDPNAPKDGKKKKRKKRLMGRNPNVNSAEHIQPIRATY